MKNVILIGPQGCGKGTQAQFLLRSFPFTYVEAGALIRSRASLYDKKSEIVHHLSSLKGVLLPDGVVMDMICDEIEENITSYGYLFDGFPRSLIQYQSLKEFLNEKKMKIECGIYIHISDTEAITRLGARRICKLCHKSYSALIEPERKTCSCGGELIQRDDDKPTAIAQRLREYHLHTAPLLESMKVDGILREINGEQSIDLISQEIEKHL